MYLLLAATIVAVSLLASYLLLSAKIAAIGSNLPESVAAVSRLLKQVNDESFRLRLAADTLKAEREKRDHAQEEIAFYRDRISQLQSAVIGLADRRVQAASTREPEKEEKPAPPTPTRWQMAAGQTSTVIPGQNVLYMSPEAES